MNRCHAIAGRWAIIAATIIVACATQRQVSQFEIDSTMARVDTLLEREQPDSAARLVNDLVRSVPKDTMLLWRQGMLNHQLESVQGRHVASQAFRKLLQISPSEPRYHYELAQILIDQTREGLARNELYRTIALAPLDEQAYLTLTDIYLRPFFSKDASDRADSAEYVLKALIARNSRSITSLARLGAVEAFRGEFDSARYHCRKALGLDSTAIEPNLVTGYIGYQEKDFVDADKHFQQAFARMDSSETAGYRSIEYLIPPHSIKPYKKMNVLERDSLEREFWEQTDIDPTTPVNERRVEHWARVWEANLCFSDPRQERLGWKTDMGETLIRLGRPDEKERRRMSGSLTDATPVWFWQYRSVAYPCTLAFVDQMQSGNYSFPFPFRDNTGSFRLSASKEVAYTNYLRKPQQSTVERERLPIGVTSDIYQFRGEDGSTAVLQYLAVSAKDVVGVKGDSGGSLDLRQALRDSSSIPVWQFDTTIAIAETFGLVGHDSLYEKLLLEHAPGKFELSAALELPKQNRFGLVRDTITVERFPRDTIGISDLVLTSDPLADPPLGLFRQEGVTNARPERVLSGSQPVYLYFEIYNLPFDIYQQSSYQVSYTLQLVKPTESAMRSLMSKVVPRKRESVTVSLHEIGRSHDVARMIALDVSELREGSYALTMDVTDLIFNRSVSKSTKLLLTP